MVSITGPGSRVFPGTCFNSPRYSHATPNGHGIAARLSVHAASDCSKYLMSIPKAIGTFFIHRYADVRMFLRAFSSFRSTTAAIDTRIHEICQFRTALENCRDNRQEASTHFNSLCLETRNLFFYVNSNYLNQFHTETDPAKIETIRQEIYRECQQVISFQNILLAVSSFFRFFSSSTQRSSSYVVPSVRPAPGPTPARPTPARPARPIPSNLVLNIPNTVPYVQNAIPADVQQKADEIVRLREQFEELPSPPNIPLFHEDFIMTGIIALPIFDASHPFLQDHLPTLRAAGVDAAILRDNRNRRHYLDKDSFETYFATGTSGSPKKCPTCRHPTDGGINRAFLRIDTQLQDEILGFLRGALQRNAAVRTAR
jgi:hypothetical protein